MGNFEEFTSSFLHPSPYLNGCFVSFCASHKNLFEWQVSYWFHDVFRLIKKKTVDLVTRIFDFGNRKLAGSVGGFRGRGNFLLNSWTRAKKAKRDILEKFWSFPSKMVLWLSVNILPFLVFISEKCWKFFSCSDVFIVVICVVPDCIVFDFGIVILFIIFFIITSLVMKGGMEFGLVSEFFGYYSVGWRGSVRFSIVFLYICRKN